MSGSGQSIFPQRIGPKRGDDVIIIIIIIITIRILKMLRIILK
jgi:hypothetical protein